MIAGRQAGMPGVLLSVCCLKTTIIKKQRMLPTFQHLTSLNYHSYLCQGTNEFRHGLSGRKRHLWGHAGVSGQAQRVRRRLSEGINRQEVEITLDFFLSPSKLLGLWNSAPIVFLMINIGAGGVCWLGIFSPRQYLLRTQQTSFGWEFQNNLSGLYQLATPSWLIKVDHNVCNACSHMLQNFY